MSLLSNLLWRQSRVQSGFVIILKIQLNSTQLDKKLQFLARDAMMFVRPSVRLSVWDGRALWSYGAL